MRYQPVSFKRELEVFRGLFVPSFNATFAWVAIESAVDFQRVEVLSIILHPLGFRQFFWVKLPSPMIIIESRAAQIMFSVHSDS